MMHHEALSQGIILRDPMSTESKGNPHLCILGRVRRVDVKPDSRDVCCNAILLGPCHMYLGNDER